MAIFAVWMPKKISMFSVDFILAATFRVHNATSGYRMRLPSLWLSLWEVPFGSILYLILAGSNFLSERGLNFVLLASVYRPDMRLAET